MLDPVSPDGFLLACVSQDGPIDDLDEIALPPGTETPGADEPSFYFRFDVTMAEGRFEIDTCCVRPANHLSFVDLNVALIVPTFTKGIVSIGCFCRCHGDPDCNGYLDIVDVVRTINTAFRGSPSITDQDCTHERTDVDANAMTNVVDVARMIDVVFGGQVEASVFVDPCAK